MSILILNDNFAKNTVFSPCCCRNISLHRYLSPITAQCFYIILLMLMYIWTGCYVSSDYFFVTSCLTHFTSLSYSSENMIANDQKSNPQLGREKYCWSEIYFCLVDDICGPDFAICLSGQGRGALAAMTLYFISWRTGALIGQWGGSSDPLTTGHSRTSPLRQIIIMRAKTEEL